MPTATADRGWRLLVVVPVLVAVAIGTFVALRARSSDSSAGGSAGEETGAEAVVPVSAASIYDFGGLDELVKASDLVVRGRVEATSRGRAIGNDDNAVVSRIVTVRVEEVLAGSVATTSVLVEEEGWTGDGHPLVVDGARPTQEGDAGIWFLTATGDDTSGSWIVVNAQGRYLEDGDELVGAEGDDPLVADLSAGSVDELADRISRTPPGP